MYDGAIAILKGLRNDIAEGNWAKVSFVKGDKRCMLAGCRYHAGHPVDDEPPEEVAEYRIATSALNTAILRVHPSYARSDHINTIIEFNDASKTSRRRALEVTDAAILDLEDAANLARR